MRASVCIITLTKPKNNIIMFFFCLIEGPDVLPSALLREGKDDDSPDIIEIYLFFPAS